MTSENLRNLTCIGIIAPPLTYIVFMLPDYNSPPNARSSMDGGLALGKSLCNFSIVSTDSTILSCRVQPSVSGRHGCQALSQ